MGFTFTSAFWTVVICVLSVAYAGTGLALDPDQDLHDWLLRRLLQPSPHELKQERNGSVTIYDGLTEREVDTALDKNFGRIQTMMFMGTVKTNASGQPLYDAATGKLIQESGGCRSPE
jgi:hypothetical protein